MAHEIYKREGKWKKVARFMRFGPELIVRACYGMGLVLMKLAKFFWPGGWLHRRLQRKLDRWRQLRPGLTLAVFVVLALVVASAFPAAGLVVQGQRILGRVLGSTNEGLGHLAEAKNLLQGQDLTGVNSRLAAAVASFEKSRTDLNSNNAWLQTLLDLVPQKQDGDALLQATILLTQAGADWTQFYQLSQSVKVTPQGVSDGSDQGSILQQMNQHLQAGRQKTDQALVLLAGVNPKIIPADQRPVFVEVKANLDTIRSTVDTVSDVFDILTTITSGDKRILFLFENNNELRATGGFMGTFGAMNVLNGRINDLHISSIYDLDGQLKDNIAPPSPIRAVSSRWYLRDANWFTDFPQSAQVISRFYRTESQQSTPDLIVVLTPQLIVDILHISGPVTLPRYNVTFTAENFVDLTQFESSVNYDRTLNQPKQVLADFFPALLQQLGSLKGEQLVPIVSALQQNLARKQILLYATDPELERRLASYNWAGEVIDTDRDYLLVSTSNLGGTKTDTLIQQDIKLRSKVSAEGRIINTLTVTRTNPLADEEVYKNRSYLRVYVPAGSKLLLAQGFSPVAIPASPDAAQQIDPDVQKWNQATVTSGVSGTMVGRESGKTVFGNWLDLPGGQTKTVTLTYELPFKLKHLDHHSLLVQKQPGAVNQHLEYSLSFTGRDLAWQNFNPRTEGAELTQQTALDQDTFWGVILKQP